MVNDRPSEYIDREPRKSEMTQIHSIASAYDAWSDVYDVDPNATRDLNDGLGNRCRRGQRNGSRVEQARDRRGANGDETVENANGHEILLGRITAGID
jgi:hypothetical protein